eukprot:Colp12_sorted_trinity150504_noHs@6654
MAALRVAFRLHATLPASRLCAIPMAVRAKRLYSSAPQPKLFTSVICERYPVITKEPTEFEKIYEEFREKLWQERSILDSHEKEVAVVKTDAKADKKQKQKKKEDVAESKDADSAAEAAAIAEEKKAAETFQAAPRRTLADEQNNIKSVFRALDSTLYLLVKTASRKEWHFPKQEYTAEESLRQVAEKALPAVVGDKLSVYYIGNAPVAHTKEARSGPVTFYYRAKYLHGEVVPSKGTEDFVWVTRDELPQYLDKKTHDSIAPLFND